MIIEMRQKSQITIPSEIVKKLSINTGDQFEVIEKDGIISLIPVAVYPKKYVEELKKEVKKLEKQIENGTAKTFNDVEEMFKSLDEE